MAVAKMSHARTSLLLRCVCSILFLGLLALSPTQAETPSNGAIWSSLSFNPKILGAPTSLEVAFRMPIPLAQDEIVTFVLPGFKRESGSGFFSGGAAIDQDYDIYWDACAQQLFFTARGYVAAGETVSLALPASADIYLPEAGVRENSTDLLISTNGQSCSVKQ